MIEKLNSQQLLEYLDEIVAEIRSRSDICIAKNGWVYLKSCPECGSKIRMYNFEFNGTAEDIAVITNSTQFGKYPIERWEKFLDREDLLHHIDLPYMGCSPHYPPAAPGIWRIVQCGCHYGEWCCSHDDALKSYMDFMGFPIIRIPDSKEGAENVPN